MASINGVTVHITKETTSTESRAVKALINMPQEKSTKDSGHMVSKKVKAFFTLLTTRS